MNFTFHINTLLPLAALLISLVLAVRALRYISRRVSITFVLLMLAISWWSLSSMMENSGVALLTKVFWLKMSYPAVVTIPVIWLVFAAQYSERAKWLTRRNLAALMVLPVITLIMVWTNNAHHLMWMSIRLDTNVSPAADAVVHGAWFWVHAVYSYALLLAGTFYLVLAFRNSSGVYRKQSGSLIVASLAPWVGNVLFLAGIGPFSVTDPTPFAFAVTGIALLFAISRLQLLDIIPVARDEIFRSMVDGVIVVDNLQRVMDINPAAQSIVGADRLSAVGRPYNLVMPGPASFLEFKPDMGLSQAEIPIGENESQRFFRLSVSPIKIGPNVSGHLIILSDDTNRRWAEVEARERTRLQAELAERDKYAEIVRLKLDFEETIVRLSARFVGVYKVDKAIGDSLADLRSLSKASRSFFILLKGCGIQMDGGSAWCASEGAGHPGYLDTLSYDRDSWWMTNLRVRDNIHVNDVSTLPAEAAAEKTAFSAGGVKSILAVPVGVEGKMVGIIGFDAVYGLKEWTDNDSAALQVSAEIIGNAIERKLATDRLAGLVEELSVLNSQLEGKVEERTRMLAEALEAAKASSQAKSDFLASMSHELRTPLNAVIGFSQILSEKYFGDLNDKQAEYVTDIMDSGKHLLSLINDVLDLSKIEAGKMEFEMAPVDMAQLLRDSLVMVKERALVHNICLEVKVDAVDGLRVVGDERRLKQVIFNLLSNATKFTPDGGSITLSAARDGQIINVCVADSGIGITESEKTHMFEAFYQAKGGLTDKTPGTGLGLPITRNIVEKHGGRIWVESEGQNKGSRFTFTLPLAEMPAPCVGQSA